LAVTVLAYFVLIKLAPRIVALILGRIAITRTKKEQEQLKQNTTRAVRWIGALAVFAALVFALLPRFGVDLSPAGRAIGGWMGSHGVRISIIVFMAIVINRFDNRLIDRLVEHSMKRKGRDRAELRKRTDTISNFLSQVSSAVVWAIAVFMILSELGMNIGPLLASAGVLGIGIGFGAQSLVKDVLAGLFIIMENQYSRGDVVKIADIAGIVEEVNIRRTIMRDLDGIVHVVPNGEIKVASNYTKEYSRVNLNISVAYGEDLDRCIQVMNRVGLQMAEDEYWGEAIIKPPEVLRVDSLGDSGIEIKMLGDTKPIRQWEVTGELRKRIKKAFDEEGIEIPWPHTKVYFGNVLEQAAGEKVKAVPVKAPQVEEVKEAEPAAKVPRRRKKQKVLPPEDEEMGGGGDG
jgi:small conductance mechanosensitive channel